MTSTKHNCNNIGEKSCWVDESANRCHPISLIANTGEKGELYLSQGKKRGGRLLYDKGSASSQSAPNRHLYAR